MRPPLIGWLYASGMILAALLAATAAPTPTAAKDCCCDGGGYNCYEALGGPCPDAFPVTKVVSDAEQCQNVGTASAGTASSWLKPLLDNDELIPEDCRIGPQTKDKPCTLLHLLQVLVNITRLMLGIMGSLALLMFTYGGLVWLTSAGNTERVARGKTILTNAVLGILILLVSWSVVNLVVVVLSQGRGGLGSIGEIFKTPWTKGP